LDDQERAGEQPPAIERQPDAPALRPRLLIADSDGPLLASLAAWLSGHAFEVDTADSPEALEAAIGAAAFDLIVLDPGLPATGGLELCRRLSSDAAILAIGDLADSADRILALQHGVDDCLAKPFNPRELLARIRAVLRRRGPPDPVTARPRVRCRFGGFEFHLTERRLTNPQGGKTRLSDAEAALLVAFLYRPHVVFSRNTLRECIGGEALKAADRMIDLRVMRLRQKLGAEGAGLVRAIHRAGYLLDVKVTWR
jgi:two-component system OmpR family response regulator